MTHELSLIAGLLRKVDALAAELGAHRVSKVRISIGAWAPLSPAVLREHFSLASRGTAAEAATLEINSTNIPSQDVLLESIEVEEEQT